MDKVSNKDLWKRTNQVQIQMDILKRRWGWLGHALRKPNTNITRQALTWNPHGKRKRGMPKNTCRRDLEADITHANGAELETTGEDRPGLDTLEGCCAWPMLQEEPRA